MGCTLRAGGARAQRSAAGRGVQASALRAFMSAPQPLGHVTRHGAQRLTQRGMGRRLLPELLGEGQRLFGLCGAGELVRRVERRVVGQAVKGVRPPAHLQHARRSLGSRPGAHPRTRHALTQIAKVGPGAPEARRANHTDERGVDENADERCSRVREQEGGWHECESRKAAHDDDRVIKSGFALLNREELVEDRFGNKRWLSTTKVPIRNNDGKVTGLVGISRDITESKLSEEAIREANEDLARHKDELQRTLSELQRSHEDLKSAQFQLIQAEKMQSIGRLAAGIAHEVKNPLGILRMGTDYLAQNLKSSDENVSLILTDMTDAIKRADGIIMGLLDFSVPHALDTHAEDLSSILDQSIGLVRHSLGEAGITLVRELPGDLPPVWIDRNKIKQVFVNILTNAIHATPEGGTITVRTSSRVLGKVDHDDGSREADRIRAGETVVIAEVIDSGSGIPEDKLRHIFDPFFTTKATGKGTGLGLTVTKKIVELHGGSLDIRNRKEGGVAVTIMFKV